jgi:hypothetical protein
MCRLVSCAGGAGTRQGMGKVGSSNTPDEHEAGPDMWGDCGPYEAGIDAKQDVVSDGARTAILLG